ncbi:MAG: restriction endonuclease, partial [Nitrosomonas sp.]|nr:restriction endonuclease [Nitrosomonas sp.]
AGEEYQELVALVAKALNPDAEIKTGQWIEGPDGKREVDVEVRGIVDGKPHFVYIECKDWKSPVDIQAIDNIDSKRLDLSANSAILYSNSGFTKKALRKAERKGIGAVSAISAGNNLVRPVIERELVAKKLSVDKFKLTLYHNEESSKNFPAKWDHTSLLYNDLPFDNWLNALSSQLLQKYEGEVRIVEMAAFKQETPFTLEGVSVMLRGFKVEMECSRSWMSQRIREDVSLGLYNHITCQLIIPSKQSWSMGWIDQEVWEEIAVEGEPEDWTKPLELGSFRVNLILMNPIPKQADTSVPSIDDLISERRTDFE